VDDTVFKLPKEKRAGWLSERRAEVIGKLNVDFSKSWFGWKKDGSVAQDLGDMTYEEVILRMVRLMFVSHEKRWVNMSLRNLTGDWLRRVEERFTRVDGAVKASVLQSYSTLDDPLPFVETFFQVYPLAREQLLASEDKAYFLTISQRPGQKPAPFIPILDANFEVWFKKVYILALSSLPFPHQTLFCRIHSGQQKTLRLFSIKMLSESVFFKDLSPSSTPR
jgi:fatty acid synthase subunit alpha, fungi type